MSFPAILLFSGGLDSTTVLAIALRKGFLPLLLTFDYGQRHRIELEKSKKVLLQFPPLNRVIFSVDLTQIGGSALTSKLEVPKSRVIDDSIPVTYVPGRNMIFLSIAAAFGEVHNAFDVFFGANVLDYSGYPDCRPEFLRALESSMNIGTKAGVEGKKFTIHAPLLQMTKSEIIRTGLEMGVDYTHTHSCYDPLEDGTACGVCDSCRIRLKGFSEAGVRDPAQYRSGVVQ